ncbi:MAG: sialidase family protein [Victivallaceae bacterium]|nr:sialidase family protein [Victivallaceae bacterium]
MITDCIESIVIPDIQLGKTGVVYRNPKPYLRSRQAMHPSLACLNNGELLCAYNVGEAVENPDQATYISRSTDGGATWQPAGPVISELKTNPAAYTVRISKLSSDLIAMGGRYFQNDPDEGILNRENLGVVPMELLLVRQENGEHSWQHPQIVTPPLVGPGFEVCHSVIELRDGTWLWPTSTWRGWNGELPNGHKGLVLISRDQGKTWPEYTVTFDGGHDLIYWEQSVFELNDKLIAIAWCYDPVKQCNLPNRYVVSNDNGMSFSETRELGVEGQTCKALAFDNDLVLLAYRRCDKPGLWLNLSRFDGNRWKHLQKTPIWGAASIDSGMRASGNNSDNLSALQFGYPQMLRLNAKEVLLVYWRQEGAETIIASQKIILNSGE